MKQVFIIMIILLSGRFTFAQQEKSLVKKGNELYQQKKYQEAAAAYGKALAKKGESVEGQFNLGDAFYKQKQYDKAMEQFSKIGSAGKDRSVTAQAYHNLGNTLLENQKLEESIEAYKKSLLNNPKDDETRYNLAYAMEKLKKQQEQKKNDKNKDKNKDDKKDKQQDKNKDDKKKDEDKNKDNKDQDKKDDKNQQQQQPQPDKLSKEDAQRMLDALNNQEKQTQEKLKGKKVKATGGKPAKDW